MATIAVQKIEDAARPAFPLFQEIDHRLEAVERRAFELSRSHDEHDGHALDDWIRAEHEIMGWPAAELAEMDGVFKLEMALPGFDAKQIQIAATPHEIAVHAATKPNHNAEGEHVLWSEFGANDVYRRFLLPLSIDLVNTKATIANGLLKITAAKIATA